MVIQTHGQTLTTDQAYLGSKVSYQQALWTGALTTLHRIEADSGGLPVDFCTDDQALVRTLQNHPAQAGAPEGLVYQARELLARLPNVTLRWINGTDNRPADDLSVATWAASLGLSPAEARTEIDALREQRRADKRKKRQKSAAK